MKKQDTTGDCLFTMAQVAKMLNVSVSTVSDLIRKGDIKAVRLLDRPRIKSSEVQRFIKSLDTYR